MYKHSQTQYLRLPIFIIFLVIPIQILNGELDQILFGIPEGDAAAIWTISIIVALIGIMLSFGRLHTAVTEHELVTNFELNLIKKSISLNLIEKVEQKKVSWIWGFGVRWTPDGWMFNISGSDVIKVTYNSGKTFLIGTDDPKGLAEAVNKRLKK